MLFDKEVFISITFFTSFSFSIQTPNDESTKPGLDPNLLHLPPYPCLSIFFLRPAFYQNRCTITPLLQSNDTRRSKQHSLNLDP